MNLNSNPFKKVKLSLDPSSKTSDFVDATLHYSVENSASDDSLRFNNTSFGYIVKEVTECDYQDFRGCSQIQLKLEDRASGVPHIVFLRDNWAETEVETGDVVNVVGKFNERNECVVDLDSNFLIVHPDLLIKSSTIGTSYYCPRKAVLNEKISCFGTNKASLLGNMRHRLFQIAIGQKNGNSEFLKAAISGIIHDHLAEISEEGEDESWAREMLISSIPSIQEWVKKFMLSRSSQPPVVNFGREHGDWNVTVSEVVDIEDVVWSPKYGIKGVIDASLKVAARKMQETSTWHRSKRPWHGESFHSFLFNPSGSEFIIPLELKTGEKISGYAFNDHRAQVMLYTLLSSERYEKEIMAGLLHHMHTSATTGVFSSRQDLVGLIMRRNEHASSIIKASKPLTQGFSLPPMLKKPNACQRCGVLNDCLIYHKVFENGNAESSGLNDLFDSCTQHLTENHENFLRYWDKMISLEDNVPETEYSHLWTIPSAEKEREASCMRRLRLNPGSAFSHPNQSERSRFVYEFTIHVDDSPALKICNRFDSFAFEVGDRVIISREDCKPFLSKGIVENVWKNRIAVSTTKRIKSHLLRQKSLCTGNFPFWRLDKEVRSSFSSVLRNNLFQLFAKSHAVDIEGLNIKELRALIVDLQLPIFKNQNDISTKPFTSISRAKDYVQNISQLNSEQKNAIIQTLLAENYSLISGVPGSGKSTAISHLVKAFIIMDFTVLITAYTHSAVDNILLKLLSLGVEFMRIGTREKIHPELIPHTFEHKLSSVNSVAEISSLVSRVNVVACTSLGALNSFFQDKKFDICIVDESSQMTLPVCLGPIFLARKFVLVGDTNQLPPLVKNKEAREEGMDISLFHRLSSAHPFAVFPLNKQYRMCSDIMYLSNTLIYGNSLTCGTANVANSKLIIPNLQKLELSISHGRFPSWVLDAINPETPTVFLNTDETFSKETSRGDKLFNTGEAVIGLTVVEALVSAGIDISEIGMISPYLAQVNQFKKMAANMRRSRELDVDTVDRWQGREKDCCIVSFVRSVLEGMKSTSHLSDLKRINVAITRSRKKLIMIGSCNALTCFSGTKLLLQALLAKGWILTLPASAACEC